MRVLELDLIDGLAAVLTGRAWLFSVVRCSSTSIRVEEMHEGVGCPWLKTVYFVLEYISGTGICN